MLLSVHKDNPEPRKIHLIAASIFDNDGIVILPTDTIYGLMLRPGNKKGRDQVHRIKKMDKNQHMTLLCADIEMVSLYAKHISNKIFKVMKQLLPGPYTFIFNASKEVPRILWNQRGSIGIRIPDNKIVQSVIAEGRFPLASTSLYLEDQWYNDPELIHRQIGKKVDLVVDGGILPIEPSTILDARGGDLELIREGKGVDAIRSLLE